MGVTIQVIVISMSETKRNLAQQLHRKRFLPLVEPCPELVEAMTPEPLQMGFAFWGTESSKVVWLFKNLIVFH